jgi:ribosomal-protein-alanine N-acetyltransferase
MNPRVFARFPVLSTPRLILREPVPADAAALFELRCDEEVNRFQSHDGPATLAGARELIARWRKRFAFKAEIRWAITTRDDGAVAGTCSYSHFVPALDRGHVTYELARRAWGRGLATEAVQAMVAFGHREAGLNRIEAVVVPGNEASVRVLRKAGFEEEGLMRAYGFWKGQIHDLRMFSIVRGA